MFLAEITAPTDAMGGVYNVLNQRRGTVNEEEPIPGTPMNLLKAYLPVAESFGKYFYFYIFLNILII